MKGAGPVGLITRRAIAFAVDLAILFFFLELGCIVALLAGLEFFDPGWSPILVASSLCYFGGSESLRLGQTPGKRLTAIRVRARSGQPVMACQAFARTSLMLLLPVMVVLLYRLLFICRLLTEWRPLAEPFLITLSYAIWPISGVIGGGRVGMQDFLLHTTVTRAQGNDDLGWGSITWLYPCVVVFVASVISGAYVHVAIGVPRSSLVGFFERATGAERAACMRLARSVEDLSLRIENGPEFIAGGSTVCFSRWTDNIWERSSVDRTCAAIPDEIRNGDLEFQIHMEYVVPVTARGLVSATFHQAATQDLGRRVGRDVFTTVEFVHRWRMWMFAVITRKRYVTFVYSNADGNGEDSTFLVVLEPDRSVSIEPGIGLGGFGPDSRTSLPRW